jgi:hypothetical protein
MSSFLVQSFNESLESIRAALIRTPADDVRALLATCFEHMPSNCPLSASVTLFCANQHKSDLVVLMHHRPMDPERYWWVRLNFIEVQMCEHALSFLMVGEDEVTVSHHLSLARHLMSRIEEMPPYRCVIIQGASNHETH